MEGRVWCVCGHTCTGALRSDHQCRCRGPAMCYLRPLTVIAHNSIPSMCAHTGVRVWVSNVGVAAYAVHAA